MRDESRIVVINTIAQLRRLPEVKDRTHSLSYCIDFEKCLRTGIDAIELCWYGDEYQSLINGDLYFELYGWDCDSIVVLNPDAIIQRRGAGYMKPEISYVDIVMASYIGDLLDGIEWNMKHTSLKDPYFEQLSVEKFALETLLREIAEHSDDSTPTEILERFVQKADKCAAGSRDSHSNYTFEISRDAAMSILDGLSLSTRI